METLVAQIEGLLVANGGSMPYQALLDEISFQDRAQLPNALKVGKNQGKFEKKLAWDAEAKSTVFTVQIPVTESA